MNPENTPPAPNPAEKQTEGGATLKAVLREIVIFAVVAVCVVLPFRAYVAEPYVVDGASMDPTFHTGDYLIVNKISYELGTPKRNTVIVFRYPLDTTKNFIKRVIGLPGDTLTMEKNKLTITNADNPKGFTIDQSYIVDACPTDSPDCISSFQKTLGPDEYFVMGDNRFGSFDSRSWGVVPKEDILGEPIVQLWPLSHIGILPGDDKK